MFGKDLPDHWATLSGLKKQLAKVYNQDLALRGMMKIKRNLPFDIGLGPLSKALLPKAYDWYDIHAR